MIHWELYKKLKFEHTNKWYMYNSESVRENETEKLRWDFEINRSPYLDQTTKRPDLVIINKKERTWRIGEFPVPADYRVELKKSRKRDKYLDLSRELKKLEHEINDLPIVIGALGTVTKGLVKELEGLEITRQEKTVQTTALVRSAKILRWVLETWGDFIIIMSCW